jgi:hypothetical protein
MVAAAVVVPEVLTADLTVAPVAVQGVIQKALLPEQVISDRIFHCKETMVAWGYACLQTTSLAVVEAVLRQPVVLSQVHIHIPQGEPGEPGVSPA